MRLVATLLIMLASPAWANEPALAGTWRLLAFQIILDGAPPTDWSGRHPKGRLILTREGQMAAVLTGEKRKAATNDAERAELFKSTLAYSGKYRIEGKDFITSVDVSWNEAWIGTEQRRHWRIENNKLYIESAPAPSTIHLGKTIFGRLIWEREN